MLNDAHPILKVLLISSFMIIFFVSNNYMLGVILFIFLWLCFSIKTNPLNNSFLIILLFVLFFLSFGYSYYLSDELVKSFTDSTKLIIRFFIIIGSGIVYAKFISSSEIIYIFRKILPKNSSLIVPLLVAFRIMPIGLNITQNVLIAQKARGIELQKFKIKQNKRFFLTFMTAYFASFIDVLYNFSTIIYLRGINNNDCTIYKEYQFKYINILIIFYLITLICCTVFLSNVIEMPY